MLIDQADKPPVRDPTDPPANVALTHIGCRKTISLQCSHPPFLPRDVECPWKNRVGHRMMTLVATEWQTCCRHCCFDSCIPSSCNLLQRPQAESVATSTKQRRNFR